MQKSRREGLIAARKKKRWTQQRAAIEIGVDVGTLSRWENGRTTPHLSIVDSICRAYQMTAEALELDDCLEKVCRSSPLLFSPECQVRMTSLITRLFMPILTVTCLSWQELCHLQATIEAILKEADTMNTTSPDYHITRREAITFLAELPLATLSLNQSAPHAAKEEFLKHSAAGLVGCKNLGRGTYEQMTLAHKYIALYLPALKAIAQNSPFYHETASRLIAQYLQFKAGLAYHWEGSGAALNYAHEATVYAQESGNEELVVITFCELSIAHSVAHASYQSLLAAQKAARFIEESKTPIAPKLQSWVYLRLASCQAHNNKSGVQQSLEKAKKTFSTSTGGEAMVGVGHDYVNLIRQEGMVYEYLGQHEKALEYFQQLIDVNDPHLALKIPDNHRTHTGIINEATLTSLQLPRNKQDKELSIKLWKAGIEGAKSMQSDSRFNKAMSSYRMMKSIWPDDAEVLELQDLIVHW